MVYNVRLMRTVNKINTSMYYILVYFTNNEKYELSPFIKPGKGDKYNGNQLLWSSLYASITCMRDIKPMFLIVIFYV